MISSRVAATVCAVLIPLFQGDAEARSNYQQGPRLGPPLLVSSDSSTLYLPHATTLQTGSGVRIMDLRDPQQPKLVATYPVSRPRELLLVDAGRTLLVVGADPAPSSDDDTLGLHLVDVSEPQHARRIGFLPHREFPLHVAASEDKVAFYVIDRMTHKGAIRIIDIKNRLHPRIVKDLPYTDQCNVRPETIALSRDGRMLLVHSSELKSRADCTLYDISDPTHPKPIPIQFAKNVLYVSAPQIGRAGIYAIVDVGFQGKSYLQVQALLRGQVAPGRVPLEGQGCRFRFSEEAGRALVLCSSQLYGHLIHVIDITNPLQPRQISTYRSLESVYDAAMTPNGQYMIGRTQLGLEIMPGAEMTVVADAIRGAHRDALRLYKQGKKQAAKRAADLLETAGVRTLIDMPHTALTPSERAAVVNDYAFFVGLAGNPGASIAILRKVLEIDPERAVAYLNMAEIYRTLAATQETLPRKISMQNLAAWHYGHYKRRTGLKIAKMERFVRQRMVPATNICEYVLEHANDTGIAQIALADSPAEIDINADGEMDWVAVSGTQHTSEGQRLRISNPATGEEIALTARDSYIYEGQVPQGIAIVPFDGRYYLVDLIQPKGRAIAGVSLINKENILDRQCIFKQRVTEYISKSENKELCKRGLDGSLDYIEFKGRDPRVLEKLRRPNSRTEGDARVDFDRDGKAELVAKVHVFDSASTGCDFKYLDLADDRKDHRYVNLETALRSAQDIAGGGEFWWRRGCFKGGEHRVVKYGGKTFIERKYSGDIPTEERFQVHHLISIDQNKVVSVCEYGFNTSNYLVHGGRK